MTTMLNCTIDKNWNPNGNTSASWFRDNITVTFPDPENRYFLVDTSPDISGNYELQIRRLNARKDDAEFYCEWRSDVLPYVKSKTAYLTVLVAAQSVRLASQDCTVPDTGNVSLLSGEEHQFTCAVFNSNPAASITWFLKDTDITA